MLIRAKEKVSRRYGQNLFLKGERSYSQKSAMVRNPFPPGPHRKRRKASSDYGVHLKEKQMVRFSYGVDERQIQKYFDMADRSKENTAETFQRILETRLDNVVFRSGFCVSRSVARQAVKHGHIVVNGKKVTLPAFAVRANDVVEISPKSLKKGPFKDIETAIKGYQTPPWLSLDKSNLKAKVLHYPKPEEILSPFNFQLLVEYYAK